MREAHRIVRRILAVALSLAPVVHAEEPPPPAPPPAQSQEEVARLRREVQEQRELILRLMGDDALRADLLKKLGQAVPAPSEPGALKAWAPKGPTARVTGQVTFPDGDARRAFVFVQDVRAPPAKGLTLQVHQHKKQFIPDVAVVPRGTTVSFPNHDAIFHNVFSVSDVQSFDLGTYRAGDAGQSVVMSTPGLVDVFCNMHSGMHASILVAPSNLFVQVGRDGTFVLDRVPLGRRKIGFWSPEAELLTLTVDVRATGAAVTASLKRAPKKAHLNKFGQPYGSYAE